jgi:hypothetical protein
MVIFCWYSELLVCVASGSEHHVYSIETRLEVVMSETLMTELEANIWI